MRCGFYELQVCDAEVCDVDVWPKSETWPDLNAVFLFEGTPGELGELLAPLVPWSSALPVDGWRTNDSCFHGLCMFSPR